METRQARYAKYRENIRKLPSDVFTDEGKFAATSLNLKELKALSNVGLSSGAISYPSKEGSKGALELTSEEERKSPYSYYLAKKKKAWVIKILIAILVAGGLTAFYFLFVIGF